MAALTRKRRIVLIVALVALGGGWLAFMRLVSPDAAFLAKVRDAVRDPMAGVFVVRIEDKYRVSHSNSNGYSLLVCEALKAFRTDDGTYFVPSAAYRKTSDRAAELEVGRDYVLIIRLEPDPAWLGATFEVWARDAQSLGRFDADAIRAIREDVGSRAIYGSSDLLSEAIRIRHGCHGPRPDGAPDPDASGFTTELLSPRIAAGERLWVVKPISADPRSGEVKCDVVRTLDREPVARSPVRVVSAFSRPSELDDRPRNYLTTAFRGTPAPFFLVLVKDKGETVDLQSFLPIIHPECPTVEEIRTRVAAASQ